MRYAIYLDDVELEVFESGETLALAKYNEIKEEYEGEDIYEKIQLVKFEIVQQDTL